MEEKNNEINKKINSSNIFNEFIDDSSLIEEVDKLKRERNKDLFFYISKIGHWLQVLFWFLFFLLIILFSYVYIQKNENLKNSSLLDPFCWIFLWDIKKDWEYCSSIVSLKATYLSKLDLLQKEQTLDILKNIETLYRVENFTKSKEVIFLNDKSDNKLQVLSILEEFDNMKVDFNIEKQKIECSSLFIDSAKKILTMNCESYSQWFEKWLRGLDWTTNNTLKWTSLSQANSFLNFIEKTSDTFEIIDRQKMFKEESVLWTKTGLTSKTPFTLKLKYNLNK
jgi:hypothetical protein